MQNYDNKCLQDMQRVFINGFPCSNKVWIQLMQKIRKVGEFQKVPAPQHTTGRFP